MAEFRIVRQYENITIVPLVFIYDNRLSLEARALAIILWQKPNGEYQLEQLVQDLPDDILKINAAINELVTYGYLHQAIDSDDANAFWFITDKPEGGAK